MHLVCCAVFDSAIQSYLRPFFVQTRAVANRTFIDEVNRAPTNPDDNNPIYSHPDDYELHYLCTLDDNTGKILDNTHALMTRAKDVATHIKPQ